MEINSFELFKLKDDLNNLAEESNREYNTSKYIFKYLKGLSNSEIFVIPNSCSIIAVFQTKKVGKTILFRADMDAINFNGKPTHLCGHNAHTSILLSFASLINTGINSLTGTVILLFQAAEEIGVGANEVLESGVLDNYKIDYLYALHNLPGYPINSIVVSNSIFAKASSGIKINLVGKASHAAEPIKGISFDYYIAEIISLLHSLTEVSKKKSSELQITITHINFGKPSFGTILNEAEILAVIRSSKTSDIEDYKARLDIGLSLIHI